VRDGTGNDSGVCGLTSGTNEISAFVGNRVPIPLEELNDDLCQEKGQDRQNLERGTIADLCQQLAWVQARPRRERLWKQEQEILTLLGIMSVVRDPK